jgi:hypothetical protein
MQISLSVCFRYNGGHGCIAGCLAKMAYSWKTRLPMVTVLNSELLLDRMNKVRAFLWEGSVLHRPWISAHLYHVDQSIRLRCIVSIWLPLPESIHFLRTLGNWFLNGNISVYVIPLCEWLSHSRFAMATGFDGYDRACCVLASYPYFCTYHHMAAHTWFVCFVKDWCLASMVTEFQRSSAWILRWPMIERVRYWIINNTGYQFQNDWSH